MSAPADVVQTNCHIADARHAADLSLCVYLLQMREFYRWEHKLPLGASLDRDDIGRWLTAREETWSRLEERPFEPIPVPGGDALPAFDVDEINRQLHPHGLVYGAGLSGRDRPSFFLADLEHRQALEDGLMLLICGQEHARSLFSPPAALQGDRIVLRKESLRRWIWEKVEAHGIKRADGPMKSFVDAYPGDAPLDHRLDAMVADQIESLVLHERGEHRVGCRLGPDWSAMRCSLADRRTDLYVRAVRDCLADLETTLPTLLDRQDTAAIHFWFATFDGIRSTLLPGLIPAYGRWCRGDGGAALHGVMAQAAPHFEALAGRLLEAFRCHGSSSGPHLQALLTGPEAVCPCA